MKIPLPVDIHLRMAYPSGMFLDPKGKETHETHKREQGAIPGLKLGWREPVEL